MPMKIVRSIPPPCNHSAYYQYANSFGLIMIMQTLTSDPAVGLELGRRLALNAKRRKPSPNRLGQMLSRLFPRPAVKLGTLHS